MALCGQPSAQIEMTGDSRLDNAERADLLCFLVLAQLIGHASTGEWLRANHVVESARLWAISNSFNCDWLDRAKLARMSAELAPQFLIFPWFMDAAAMAKLFADGWQLDYRSPILRGMLDVCLEHLLKQ
jgi:hypothetical protein